MMNSSRIFNFAFIAGCLLLQTTAHAEASLTDQIQEMRQQLQELQAQQSLNVLSFSGDLQSRFDNLSVNNGTDTSAVSAATIGNIYSGILAGTSPYNSTIKTGAVTATNAQLAGILFGAYGSVAPNTAFTEVNNYYRLKTDLNFNATSWKNVKFYSRITASKFMNEFDQQGSDDNLTMSFSAPNSYLGDQIWLSRAYVDWAFTRNWTFSLGRLPSTDGPPANFPDGRSRTGTYPAISFNNYIDGFALTYKAQDWMPAGQGLTFRAIYSPISNVNFGGPLTNEPYFRAPWNGLGNGSLGGQSATTQDAYAFQVEYTHDKTFLADDSSIILQFFNTAPFHVNQTAPTSSNNNGDPTNEAFGLNEATLMVELDGVHGSDFDISASYNYTNVTASGTQYLPVPFTGTVQGGTGTITSYAYVPYGGFGCAPNVSNGGMGCNATYSGGNTLISARYRFKSKRFVGAEFAAADPNSLYFAGADDTIEEFYGTHGQGYHVYYTEMFAPTMSLRVGGIYQNITSSQITFSQSVQGVSEFVTNLYTTFRLDF